MMIKTALLMVMLVALTGCATKRFSDIQSAPAGEQITVQKDFREIRDPVPPRPPTPISNEDADWIHTEVTFNCYLLASHTSFSTWTTYGREGLRARVPLLRVRWAYADETHGEQSCQGETTCTVVHKNIGGGSCKQPACVIGYAKNNAGKEMSSRTEYSAGACKF